MAAASIALSLTTGHVYVPMGMDPLVWGVLALAAWIEARADRVLLRRLHVDPTDLLGGLGAAHFLAWFSLIAFNDWMGLHSKRLLPWGLYVLDLLFVAVKVLLIRIVGWLVTDATHPDPIRMRTAIALAVLGDAITIAFIGSIHVIATAFSA